MSDETFTFSPRNMQQNTLQQNRPQLNQIQRSGSYQDEPTWDWPDPPTIMTANEFLELSKVWYLKRSDDLKAVDTALADYNNAYATWNKAKTDENCSTAYQKLEVLRTKMRDWGFAKLLKYGNEEQSARAIAMDQLRDQVFVGWAPQIWTPELEEQAKAFQEQRRVRFRALLAGRRLEFKVVAEMRKKNGVAAYKEAKKEQKQAKDLLPLADQLNSLTANALGTIRDLANSGVPLPDLAALLPLLDVAAALGNKLPSGWLPNNLTLSGLGAKLGSWFRSAELAKALPAFLNAIRPPTVTTTFIDAVQSRLAEIGKLRAPKVTDLLPSTAGLSTEQVMGPVKAILAILESMPLDELDKIVPESLVPSALLDPMSPAIIDLKIGLTSVLAAFDPKNLAAHLTDIKNQVASIKAAIISAAETIKNLQPTITLPTMAIPLYQDVTSLSQRLGSWVANMLANAIQNLLSEQALLVLRQTLDNILSITSPAEMARKFLSYLASVVGVDLGALAASMVPFLGTAVQGAKAAKQVYAAYKRMKEANSATKFGRAFTEGANAQAALDGLKKALNERMKDQIARATASVASFSASLGADLGTVFTAGVLGIAQPAFAIAQALGSAVSALVYFAQAVEQTIAVNELLVGADAAWAALAKGAKIPVNVNEYPLGVEVIDKSPVVACYLVAYAQPDELLHMVVLPKGPSDKPYKLGEVHWDPEQNWQKQLGVLAERHLDPLRKLAKDCLKESMLVLDEVHEWATEPVEQGTTATNMKKKSKLDAKALLNTAKGLAPLMPV